MRLCKKCGKIIPWQITIDGKRKDLSCRKYCIECHPIGMKVITKGKRIFHYCKKCGDVIPYHYNYRKGDKKSICLKCIPRKNIRYCVVCGKELKSQKLYCSKKCMLSLKPIRNEKLILYKRRLQLKYKALEINGNLQCSCSENNIYLLEFHHKDEKKFQIGDRIYNYSPNKDFPDDLIQEIKKCIVLCKKCHIKQHPEFINIKPKKNVLYVYSGSKCRDCDETNILFMHWHHRDPKTKKFEIGRGIKDDKSLEKLKEEVDKCDMLCTHCHTLRFKKEHELKIGYKK